MMTGFLEPSAGTAIINGYNIRQDMKEIYGMMGVCPQHDLLWETLTGAEHLRWGEGGAGEGGTTKFSQLFLNAYIACAITLCGIP